MRMRSPRSFLVLFFVACGALLIPGLAQQQDGAGAAGDPDGPLDVRFESYVVTLITLDDGTTEERFEEATVARPGDVIEYRMLVTNISEAPVSNIVLVGPVHDATTYLADSADATVAATLEFSADGGETFSAPPVMITIIDDAGDEIQIVADPELYDALRWTLTEALAPNADDPLLLAYRVRVN